MSEPQTPRVRRAPPAFQPVTVRATEARSPWLVRVTFAGDGVGVMAAGDPAASVRLLLPSAPGQPLVVPEWAGNEFLLPGGQRPAIRTLTPIGAPGDADGLAVDIVLHAEGVASEWARAAVAGAEAAVSGPGRGYAIGHDTESFVLVGDETAIPAVSQLLASIPPAASARVHLEIAHADAELALPQHPGARIAWHVLPAGAPPGDTLVAAISDEQFTEGTRVWAAGEAAAMQRIRRHLFEERHVDRSATTVRGYWKHGRTGDRADA